MRHTEHVTEPQRDAGFWEVWAIPLKPLEVLSAKQLDGTV